MPPAVRIFLDFTLPNATTWFYFSFLLAVAVFFKFSRLWSVRNLDILTLFLLMPGLMFIQASRPSAQPISRNPTLETASLVASCTSTTLPTTLAQVEVFSQQRRATELDGRFLWIGYLWLICGSGYFFLRCLIDLVLVQRPALAPNLTFGGLAWLAMSLVVCLSAVVFRQNDRPAPPVSDGTLTSEGLRSPQGKAPPETAFVTLVRQWLDPTSVMMRTFAMAGHLIVVLGLLLLGRIHYQDALAGMAAATFYLMLPYTGMFVRQVDQVWPMAIIVWMLVAYRIPSLAGLLLGFASGSLYYPVLLFPVLLSFYRGRGAGRFSFFFLLGMSIVLGAVAFALDLQGHLGDSIRQALDQASWQPWKTLPADSEGFWPGVHAAYRIPVFIAYAAFVIATAFWPAPKNLAHLLALSTAVLIGTQFWYGDQGGTYVLWYLPLLVLIVFRPNLESARPPLIDASRDWLGRLRAWVWARLRPPVAEPTAIS